MVLAYLALAEDFKKVLSARNVIPQMARIYKTAV
jgi:hypothetical protein